MLISIINGENDGADDENKRTYESGWHGPDVRDGRNLPDRSEIIYNLKFELLEKYPFDDR